MRRSGRVLRPPCPAVLCARFGVRVMSVGVFPHERGSADRSAQRGTQWFVSAIARLVAVWLKRTAHDLSSGAYCAFWVGEVARVALRGDACGAWRHQCVCVARRHIRWPRRFSIATLKAPTRPVVALTSDALVDGWVENGPVTVTYLWWNGDGAIGMRHDDASDKTPSAKMGDLPHLPSPVETPLVSRVETFSHPSRSSTTRRS